MLFNESRRIEIKSLTNRDQIKRKLKSNRRAWGNTSRGAGVKYYLFTYSIQDGSSILAVARRSSKRCV